MESSQEDDRNPTENDQSKVTERDYLALLDPDSWPTPKWMMADSLAYKHRLVEKFFGLEIKYIDYFASDIRARYMKLEADFRTMYSEYVADELSKCPEGKQCLEARSRALFTSDEYLVILLRQARSILENHKLTKQMLLTATNLLDLAERSMVWIISPEAAGSQITMLISRLEDVKPRHYDEYVSDLIELRDKLKKNENSEAMNELRHTYRTMLDEIIWQCNRKSLDDKINIGLQIERLEVLRSLGIIFFAVFFLSAPIFFKAPLFWDSTINSTMPFYFGYLSFAPPDPDLNCNLYRSNLYSNYLSGLIWTFGIAIIGGAGGFLSGLLQARGSKSTLALYEESVVLLQLRPIFGAFAAILLSMLLAWGLLEDILTQSPGSYILLAFLSGFSERYFLDILKINPESSETEMKPDTMGLQMKHKTIETEKQL